MKNIKKAILPVFVLLLLAFIVYEHIDEFNINKIKHSFNFEDKAEYVLNANIPNEELIDSFYNETYEPIYLPVGIQEDYGFRHILARHTVNYFVNFANKNKNSLFPDEIKGADLIDGIIEFYEHCVDVPRYNRGVTRNMVYIGFTEIKGERIKCLLIVREANRQIVSFYPFKEDSRRNLIDYD